MRLLGRKPAYKGTISDLRISAVDGTAFIDACAAITTYADGNHRIEIYDSANKMLAGFLKAQGSGETLGAELFDADARVFTSGTYSWIAYGTNTIENDANTLKITFVDNAYGAYLVCSDAADLTTDLVVGAHYVVGWDTKTVGAVSFGVTTDGGGTLAVGYTETSGTFASHSGYFTAQNAKTDRFICKYMDTVDILWVDNLTLRLVTAPSTSGVTVVSEKEGSTQNWLTKDAGFAYNKASYRVIVREYA